MIKHPLVWIIIGVSGSGKTTIGRLLSQWLECDFREADRRHSKSNIDKMIAGKALEDNDRTLWLLDIEEDIRQAIDRKLETVITCSALKADYRRKLTSLGHTQLVWIDVPEKVLIKRLKGRSNHFLPSSILSSQLATFEAIFPQEDAVVVNGNQSIDLVMKDLIAKALERYPNLNNCWWERSRRTATSFTV